MKRAVLTLAILLASSSFIQPNVASAMINFGDFRSETLTTKAWSALNGGDLEAVLAYTNKCLELYGDQAKKMQNSLNDYPSGTKDQIVAYWALNDIATSLFIQGEAYRKADMNDKAMESYKRVVNEYSYGQAWDPNGWFWKPAEAASEKIAMIEADSNLDFGDYSSSFLTNQAWNALRGDDADAVVVYTDKILELYEEQAQEMQNSMTEYAWESHDAIFAQWALNDVGTALYIKGEAFKKIGDHKKAKKSYQELVQNYYYAQCWDPSGWFWKPAEAAQQSLDELGEI